MELSDTRPTGFTGPGRITRGEIAAWQAITGVTLSPWEAETLIAIDRAAVAAQQDDPK